MALESVERGDYERFHDLAWRAIQTGPKNDPALMYLLARAQSLSGRPGDALVMLQRLADMGVPTDAATNDDFRRVRALPGWTAFVARGSGSDLRLSADATKPRETEAVKPAKADAAAAPNAAPAAGVGTLEAPKPGKPDATSEAVRFTTLPFTPAGLAYDAVSRRFIVGDRRARRLAVVDEFSHHVANLASAQSAGFGDIVAIEIDPRQGDLWVISANNPQSILHKLQLISGRSLGSYVPPERFGDVELVDVAATADNGVLALDRAGHRIFRLRPKAAAIELALTLPDDQPASIAPATDTVVYVAQATGISRVDLASRVVSEVKPARGVDLSGITRLRWHNGALVGVQRSANGTFRAVRIDLDGQSHAPAIRSLDTSAPAIDPTGATIAGGVLYYLAGTEGPEMTVRRVPLK